MRDATRGGHMHSWLTAPDAAVAARARQVAIRRRCPGQSIGRSSAEGTGHGQRRTTRVRHRTRPGDAAVVRPVRREPSDDRGPSWRGPAAPPGRRVGDHGRVAVPLPDRGLVHGGRLDPTEVDPAEGLLPGTPRRSARPPPGSGSGGPRRRRGWDLADPSDALGRPSRDQGVTRQPIEAFELGPHRGRSGRQRGTTGCVSASRFGRSRARRTVTSWAPPTPSPRPSHRSARPGSGPGTITATVRSRRPCGPASRRRRATTR